MLTATALRPLLVACFVAAAAAAPAAARAASPDGPARYPTFEQMIQDSSVVVLLRVEDVAREFVRGTVVRRMKGEVQGAIGITGFGERVFQPIPDARRRFSVGDEWVFFLAETLVGDVPYTPAKLSTETKKSGDKVRVNPFDPGFPDFAADFDAKTFLDWIGQLSQKALRKPLDPEFVGPLRERLEAVAKVPEQGAEAAFLTYVLTSIGTINDEALFKNLLKSNDVNARYVALDRSRNLPKNARAQLARPALEDAARIIQSLAAKVIEEVQAVGYVDVLEKLIDKAPKQGVEAVAANPRKNLESPKKAILRALVSFEGEEALDAVERELLKNKADSFLLILDIFKEFDDDSIFVLLLELMQDANYRARQVAILDYFRSVRTPEIVESLKRLYEKADTPVPVRRSIIEVFENYAETAQMPMFLKALGDPNAMVRQAAAKALGNLNAVEAVPQLKETYFRERDRLAREFYINALAEIRDRTAYEALQKLLEEESDDRLKGSIKRALERSKFLSQ